MTIVERGNTARAWRAPWSVRIETGMASEWPHVPISSRA